MKKNQFSKYILSLLTIFYASFSHGETPPSTLEKIASQKVINIGYRNAPPYSYKTSDGHVVGYVIELCKDVTESLKKELHLNNLDVHYVPVPLTARITMLNNNTVDMDCSINTDTIKRQSVVSFSRHYQSVYTRIGTRSNVDILSTADLAGKTVSVTTSMDLTNLNLFNRAQNLNLLVLPQTTLEDAFDTMGSGKSYATAMNEVSLHALIESRANPGNYKVSDITLGDSQTLGIMLRHNDVEFKKMIDSALLKRFKRDDFKPFYEQWFNGKLPDKNINLHMPLTPEMYEKIIL